MKSHPPRRNALRLAVLSMFAAGVVACGGDGGGEAPPSPTDLLDVTAANSDTVVHAAAAALFAIGSASSAIPADAGSGVVAQAVSPALQEGGLGMSSAWLPRRVLTTLVQLVRADRPSATGRQARALEVTAFPPEDCAISGTMTTTVDDRDNNNELSLDDVVTIVFSNCKDSPEEVLNGSATVAVTRVGATVLPSFGASMSLMQLSQEATNGSHGLSINGKLRLDYEQTSNTSERTRLTADGAVMIAAHAHQSYNDTVTLQTGFEQLSFYDMSAGITRNDATGLLQSEAAGSGLLIVSTPQSIEVADTDQYPRSGAVKIAGQGSIVLTATSSSTVQIALDADGDDSYESRRDEGWDWLF